MGIKEPGLPINHPEMDIANTHPFVYLIPTESFDPDSGGIICLHRLCHELNSLGHKAYLVKMSRSMEISSNQVWRPFLKVLAHSWVRPDRLRIQGQWNTPTLSQKRGFKLAQQDNVIVVYPEMVFGNPLKSRNVVRWLLHAPGFHAGKTGYGFNEFHIQYNNALPRMEFPGCHLSQHFLPVRYAPLDLYARQNQNTQVREGYAYLVRKGKAKPPVHDESWLCIDGLSHEKSASIMGRVKYFVSYDPYTAFSRFAALAGCLSVVVPDAGVSKSQWYPSPEDRLGVAYGFDDTEHALSTRHLLLERMQEEQDAVTDDVRIFAQETQTYFTNRQPYDFFRRA